MKLHLTVCRDVELNLIHPEHTVLWYMSTSKRRHMHQLMVRFRHVQHNQTGNVTTCDNVVPLCTKSFVSFLNYTQTSTHTSWLSSFRRHIRSVIRSSAFSPTWRRWRGRRRKEKPRFCHQDLFLASLHPLPHHWCASLLEMAFQLQNYWLLTIPTFSLSTQFLLPPPVYM